MPKKVLLLSALALSSVVDARSSESPRPGKEKPVLRSLEYPKDIKPEYTVSEKAHRSLPASLAFTPPAAATLAEGRIETSATLSNPTAKPVKVVFWLGAFRLTLEEDEAIRLKPRDPKLPPLPPPVPPPPFQLTLPARSTVKFTDAVYLDGYLYQGNPVAQLEWTLSLAEEPRPSGTLSIALPTRPPAQGAETGALLERWNSLPDLNLLARQRAGKGDTHALLGRLEKEHRREKRAFRRGTFFRHQETCSTGEHSFAASEILAVGPRGDSVETTGLAIHEAEAHGAALPAEVTAFLAALKGN